MLLGEDKRVALVFWHGKYLPLFTLLRGRQGCVFASRSFRGEVICGICRCLGYKCVTIPGHSGRQTFDLMRQTFRGCQSTAIAVDGPSGPYHVVRTGSLRLAAGLGMTVLPVSFAANRSKILKKRWDRMEIPFPFTRVCLMFGESIAGPDNSGHPSVNEWGENLQGELENTEQQALRRLQKV